MSMNLRQVQVSTLQDGLRRIDRGFVRLTVEIDRGLMALCQGTAMRIAMGQAVLAPTRSGRMKGTIRVAPLSYQRSRYRGWQTEVRTDYARWMQRGFRYPVGPGSRRRAAQAAMGSFYFPAAGRRRWVPQHEFVTDPADAARPGFYAWARKIVFANVQSVQTETLSVVPRRAIA